MGSVPLANIFLGSNFMPHIHCYLDRALLVWTMFVTDMLIGLAYVCISLTLVFLVKKIKLPFNFVVLCFGLFIAACGATHFMEVWTLWHPDYWISAFVKALTAVASVGTGVYLFKLRNAIIHVAGEAKLSETRRLELEELTKTLEERVLQRTKSFEDLESRFQKVSNATDLGVWYSDLPFDELIWNEKTKEHFWFDPKERINIGDVYKHIHPDDRVKTRKAISDSIKDHMPFDVECRTVNPASENSWKWIKASGWTDYNSIGTPIRFDGITIDITESKRADLDLKRTSSILHAVMTSTADMVYVKDRQSRMVYCNPTTLKLIGKTEDELYGKNDIEFLGPGKGGEAILETDGRIMSSASGETAQEWVTWKDGSQRLYMSRKQPHVDSSGKIIGVIGISTDITELKRIQSELEEAVKSRDEFLSIASHELKTPLTTLKLQSQTLTRLIEKDDPTAFSKNRIEELAEQTNKQVSRLNKLVDDMLDIGRLRSGQFSVVPEKFDLCELVKESISRLSPQFTAAGCGVPKLTYCENAVGTWDRMRIEQVISNLFINAIKYGKGKPVEIEVHRNPKDVLVSIKDYGIGVAKENHKKIFDRFERAISANEVSGLGLGLFISQQIVAAHKGSIWVESEQEKGSTFFVSLPIS